MYNTWAFLAPHDPYAHPKAMAQLMFDKAHQDYLFVAPEGKALPAEEFKEKKGTVKMMGFDGSPHDLPGQGPNGSSKKGQR